MKQSDGIHYAAGAVLLAGVILHLAGGRAALVGVPIAFVGGLLYLVVVLSGSTGSKKNNTLSPPKTEVSFPRILEKQAENEAEPEDPAQVLGRAHRKMLWGATEQLVDTLLDDAIALVRAKMEAHTVAVFFPTLDNGYMLRRYDSVSEHINTDAVLYPGVGVIGSFLKEGAKQVTLNEVVSDSATLYYYTQDAGVRSLVVSPIVADGSNRGTIIVDSTTTGKFTGEHRAFLDRIASLLGQAVFSSYMHTEHKLQHSRLAAMGSIEKAFFSNLTRKGIVGKITEIVPLALPCDRLTISMKSEENDRAVIVSVVGADADAFEGKTFSLKEKSLVSIVYSRNIVLSRNFSDDHYEMRYFVEERENDALESFVAVPLGVDDCKGVLLVESRRRDVFDESYLELLTRLGTSAGLAIEKMLIFEKANALATHDGLTGLYNHRTFQQMLADEITRGIRYKEPVALIICDIDFFKKINDSYGHPFGDVVLKGVSALLENSIRQDIDTVARYGGEEFALILVKTDAEGAAETAERIRAAIAASPFSAPAGGDVKVTMSFGIAEYRTHARQLNELIAKADKALYRAKENGRNRVEVF